MSSGTYCVAGWDTAAKRMVRPLPGASNWPAALLQQHGIVAGKLIRAQTRGISNGIFAHRTEDTPIDQASIGVSNGVFSDWLGPSAGFAKADDLAYFLKKIGGIEYVHQPLLAPTDLILKAYKKEKGDWRAYQDRFLGLMSERHIEHRFKPEMFDGACLLCSEAMPHHCHRRLVCEYLNDRWDGALQVRHL